MKDWKDTMTIEISTPEGGTSGPMPVKEFSRRTKQGLKAMAKINDDSTPEYWPDSQLEEIAAGLIQKHHNHLIEAQISYRVTSKTMSRAGKAIAGKAKKASGLLQHFAGADFVIVVSDAFWVDMDRRRRTALVDHELCHCSIDHDDDGNRSWVLAGHDTEEFTAVIDRHGLWHDGLKPFAEAVARQLELPLKADEKPKKKATVSAPAGPL